MTGAGDGKALDEVIFQFDLSIIAITFGGFLQKAKEVGEGAELGEGGTTPSWWWCLG